MPLRNPFGVNPTYGPGVLDEPHEYEGLPPQPEDFEGDVMPGGRGIENHGVKPTAKYEDIPGYDGHPGKRYIIEEPVEDEPDPTPVRIVGTSRHTRKKFRASTYSLVTSSDLGVWKTVLGRQDNRTAVSIGLKPLTIGGTIGRVWVGAGDGSSAPLDTGDSFSYSGTEDVWMMLDSAATSGALLVVMTEYEVPE